jgi:hypothetical protein
MNMSLSQLPCRKPASWFLATTMMFGSVPAVAWAQGTADRPRAALAVWDTDRPSAEPLTPEEVAQKNGWKLIAADQTAAFQGDAVITNGRVLMVARKRGTGLELYSLGLGHPLFRAQLLPGFGAELARVEITENSRASVGLKVASKRGTTHFRLKRGDLFVEVQALSAQMALRIACPSRFAVLPDFFADDILCDARQIPVDRFELPSENFFLLFTGKQDAVVMNVFENRSQDVRVTLAGLGNERAITGSEIAFGKPGSKVWVAVLEGTGAWYTRDIGPADANQVLPLEWTMPFVAQWRVDFTRQDGATDSWDMLLAEKDGNGFIKPSWLAPDGHISIPTRTASGGIDRDAYKAGGPASDRLGPERKRWTTVLGFVPYPCWTDRAGQGFLQPLRNKKCIFQGPVLIYALNRLADTPIQSYTPVDIVRNTLGVGPCQYLLDVEGQKQEHVGRATCHVRALLNEIYGSGQQKARQKEIESYLGDALDFVTHIRNRVLLYVAFGQQLRTYLADQRVAHPELKQSLDALDVLALQIDERVQARMQAILQHKALKDIPRKVAARHEEPTPSALAAQLNRDFIDRGLLAYEGADWKDRLKKEYTDPLTAIGGQQDEMVGECRWVVKALRQKAGLQMALDPRMTAIATEVRARTQKVLRGGAAYEGARH